MHIKETGSLSSTWPQPYNINAHQGNSFPYFQMATTMLAVF